MRARTIPRGHRPCANPSVCNVQSHRPGTVCRAEGGRGAGNSDPIPSLSVPSSAERTDSESIERFSLEEGGYYGNSPPRSIQIEALNGTIEALDRDDKTQLIAACGTGKTYMGRQLLSHYMSQDDSSGISVVLTSSRKLAADTARDMRPGSGDDPSTFDAGFGEYGEDYEVIEVHSDAQDYDLHGLRRPSIRASDGNISSDLIREQIESAQEGGKKVVIVSTYKSSRRIREAQDHLDDADADLIMHDEAHNILGQQKTASKRGEVSDDETTSDSTVYSGFDNSIPGSIQSRKRLYATATPVMREFDEDDESEEGLESAIATARRIASGHTHERVTFYSTDTDMVGGIGGYISQRDAIDQGYLAEPVYQLREANLNGDVSRFNDPVVGADGSVMERRDTSNPHPMSPATYSAVVSGLEAMADDPERGASPRNMLIYAGSIEQSEAASENMKAVALSLSEGMSESAASMSIDSPDLDLRRRARMRVLADSMQVKHAHSGMPAAAKQEAFGMFEGNEVDHDGWSPDCRVLANVDIFSEGVNIPEIDGIVLSDRSKLSERGMTQSVGRAIRTIGGNDVKRRGYVIIPRARDSAGNDLSAGNVNRAIYGATRVERGVTARRIRGESIGPDQVTHIELRPRGLNPDDGPVRVSAQSMVQNTIESSEELVRSYQVKKIRRKLIKDSPITWENATANERLNMVKTEMGERIEYIRGIEDPNKRLSKERRSMEAALSIMDREIYSPFDAEWDEVNHETLMSAVPASDLSAMNHHVRNEFIRKGVLVKEDGAAQPVPDPRVERARSEHVRNHMLSLAASAYRNRSSPHHGEIRQLMEQCGIDKNMMSKGVLLMEQGRSPWRIRPAASLGRPTPGMTPQQIEQRVRVGLDEMHRRMDGDPDLMDKFMDISKMGRDSVDRDARESLNRVDEAQQEASTRRAGQGDERYVINPSMTLKSGHLNKRGTDALLDGEDQ